MSQCRLINKFAAACVAMAILAACSTDKEKPIQEYITEDTSMAAMVNLDMVFRQAGLPFGKGQTLDEARESIMSLATGSFMSDQLEPLVSAHAIDTSQLLLLKSGDSKAEIACVRVADEDAFDSVTGDEGYTAKAVRVGSLCFLSESGYSIERLLADVEKEQPESLAAIKEFLSGSNAANVVYHSPVNLGKERVKWITATFSAANDILSAEVQALDGETNYVNFGDLFGEIDPSILGFIPSDAVAAASFGRPAGDMRWLDKVIGQSAGVSTSDLRGTSALSLSLAGSVDNLRTAGPEAYNIQFVTAVDDTGKPDIAAKFAERYPAAKSIDGQRVGSEYGCDIYAAGTDGYFAISLNRPVSPAYGNDLAPYFEGKRFAVAINIPYGSSLMKGLGLSCGVSLNIGCTSNMLKARLRFNGSSKPALQTLAEFDSDLTEFIAVAPSLLM